MIKGTKFKNLSQILCDYGCGKNSEYIFKNGKSCCEDSFYKCIGFLKKLSKLRKGKLSPHKGKKRNYSKEARQKMANRKGKPAWNSGLKNCFSDETLIKMRKPKGNFESNDPRRQKLRERMLNGGSKKANDNNYNRRCSQETKKKISTANMGKKCPEKVKILNRQRLLNGQALNMIKAIKKISKDEIKLRTLVKKLYDDCEFQYKVFNYSLDVALPKYKIAIEFDGYYHFNCQENIDYHMKRRNKIIKEGWKFYRVTMFDKFPSLEEVKEKIENLKL